MCRFSSVCHSSLAGRPDSSPPEYVSGRSRIHTGSRGARRTFEPLQLVTVGGKRTARATPLQILFRFSCARCCLVPDVLKSDSRKGAADVRLNSIVDRVVQSADHVKAQGIGCIFRHKPLLPSVVMLVCLSCRVQLSFLRRFAARMGGE